MIVRPGTAHFTLTSLLCGTSTTLTINDFRTFVMNTDELCIGPTATSNPAIPCKLVHMWRDFFSPIVLSKVEFSMVRAIEAPIVVPTEKTLSKEINARLQQF
ncbi:hypothetical protein M405DRAFT_313278 [Rhizopogon salebrosus TDB-379]|nr:hypothetical protein M405DRAFT_604149 [Rhizopogon salebrosus TDB-379]KAJ8587348.1 hypothetical protein M405DRAFT_313278 [Rhizopogon salebrosus TDB-379]